MAYTQDGRRLVVKTPLGKDALLLNGFSGQEAISRPFSFQLKCVAENAKKVPFESILGQKVTVELALPGSSKRWVNGVCYRVAQGGRDATFTRYLLDLVPEAFLLSRKTQSRIFQHLSIPDILKKVLKGFPVTWEIQGTFHPRDYCVQYRESDFAFASRLMEEEGIYYFFKHSDGSHAMVVANTPGSHPDLPVKSSLIFDAVGGGTREEDRVTAWEKAQELRSSKVTLWDHCFELPHKHLEGVADILASVAAGKSSHKLKLGANAPLELYDFPGAYAQRFDGINKGGGEQPAEIQKIFQDNTRTAEVRMQSEAAASVLVHAGSNCRQIVSGHKFTLERHFEGDGSWVVHQVEHVASEGADVRSGGGDFAYQNHFSCFPAALPFRPPRVTPVPTVRGTQTAVVVGPSGEEIFTDKYGRVKVQFHWDREGKNDSDSSCWVRVGQPIAGRRWGASFWPRIGQEVIVDFLEGDPDQPIIVGSVYNSDQMPPYLGDGPDSKHKNDNKLTGVKSNTTLGGEGFNEWRFDDAKDKEQIFVHAEKNMDTRVKNDSMESVGGNKHLTVGGEKDGQTSGDYKELVYGNVYLRNRKQFQQIVGGGMFITVGTESEDPGDLQTVVKGDRAALVEKDEHVHVKGSAKEKIDGSLGLTVGGDLDAKVGTKLAAEAGQEIHLKGGMKVIIEAGMQLTLKGPGGFIDIGPSGVAIQGIMVQINSGGAAGSGSGASPASPDDAKEANKHDPTVADNAKTGYKSCP
ncbi:MAG: type VI secretion system tip protein VgrG [Thermoanaerobaculia bacterium]|nr:type VI secretion system tip protein VgrG [Thermoanaerobaculia bacterium]